MSALAPATLLSVWEHGLARHPLDRALLLLTLACPDIPAARLADIPLGQRNRHLMRLHDGLFGGTLELTVRCPACRERMVFPFAAHTLPDADAGASVASVEARGLRFTLPTTRHLAHLGALGGTHANMGLASPATSGLSTEDFIQRFAGSFGEDFPDCVGESGLGQDMPREVLE